MQYSVYAILVYQTQYAKLSIIITSEFGQIHIITIMSVEDRLNMLYSV